MEGDGIGWNGLKYIILVEIKIPSVMCFLRSKIVPYARVKSWTSPEWLTSPTFQGWGKDITPIGEVAGEVVGEVDDTRWEYVRYAI